MKHEYVYEFTYELTDGTQKMVETQGINPFEALTRFRENNEDTAQTIWPSRVVKIERKGRAW